MVEIIRKWVAVLSEILKSIFSFQTCFRCHPFSFFMYHRRPFVDPRLRNSTVYVRRYCKIPNWSFCHIGFYLFIVRCSGSIIYMRIFKVWFSNDTFTKRMCYIYHLSRFCKCKSFSIGEKPDSDYCGNVFIYTAFRRFGILTNSASFSFVLLLINIVMF